MSSNAIINYTFNAGAKTITLLDFDDTNSVTNPILINLIFNETTNQSIYKVTDTLNFTITGNVITLTGSTAGMNNSDKLRIEYGTALSSALISGLITDGTDMIVAVAGANTVSFSLAGSSNASLFISVDAGVTYKITNCYKISGNNIDSDLSAGESYIVSCAGVTNLKFVFNGGPSGGFMNVAVNFDTVVSNAIFSALAQENTQFGMSVNVEHINDKTPALGQALAAGSVPVVLTAAQMSDIASEDTLLSIDATTLGIQTLTGSINTATLAIQPSVASLDTKTPSLGVAGAASSRPVTLASETITGQSGLSGTVNNILLPTTAGSAWLDVRAYKSAAVQLISSATAGTAVWECSNDGTNALSFSAVNQGSIPLANASSLSFATGNANATHIFPITTNYIRLRISVALTGGTTQAVTTLSQTPYSSLIPTTNTTITNGQTANDAAVTGNPVRIGFKTQTTLPTTLATGDASDALATTAGQLVTKPFGTSENDWSFACASAGIDPTGGAVTTTLKTAGASSIKNYLTGFDIYTGTLGAATEITIRDGSGGTVLWRWNLPTTGTLIPPNNFFTPLKGSAATAMVVTVESATTTGKVYFNARGYQSF